MNPAKQNTHTLQLLQDTINVADILLIISEIKTKLMRNSLDKNFSSSKNV